ncbi:glycine receptor subunit alpha-2-like isoform X1 [Octopus vulgaris]|uniref:Gamma-aminobutyric acid receptor subunit beta n=1 Tax=Octopus vulgaris TaxID=6645 RepID=A0AA36FIW6_OCTVU|nr:glycine receptor subunit alpha-2-like isoform X1 [Octopus vulgaris]
MAYPKIFTAFFVLILIVHIKGYTAEMKRNQVISELIKNHDRFVSPDYEEDFPTVVSVQLYVSSVDTVSEQNMEYSVTILLRQLWHDPRLNYTRMSSLSRLEMDSSRINNFWVPDLFFSNEKKGSFHDVTKPNRMLLIYRNGTVFYSIRLSLTLSCYMRLERYPMDDQICSMVMESYSYSAENVFFKWIETQKPVVVDRSIEMPQYTLKKYHATVCKKDYGEGSTDKKVAGNFSCIQADFHLTRNQGYFIIQVYIPSILIVLLSWVSFWLDVDSIPARISLGVLTVLTMTTQSSGARASLPRVSYVKAIDVWMAVCLVFVFAALLEFAYVNVLSRRRSYSRSISQKITKRIMDRRRTERQTGGASAKNDMQENGPDTEGDHGIPNNKQSARFFDKVARYTFPLVFGLFNVFYWIFYNMWNFK